MGKKFSELIKNFENIRDYMKDFFIYGFKTRTDFTNKSLRTYDNERRRIESWLNDYIYFDNSKNGKQVSISCDSERLLENPLYKVYQSKSFTDNDIQLHFFILDILQSKSNLTLNEISNLIVSNYGIYFELQTIRLKLKEYIQEGIITSIQCKNSLRYSLSTDFCEDFCPNLSFIKFYSENFPFGVIGNYILKYFKSTNDIFLTKNNFIIHTLEDNILLQIISAIDEKKYITVLNYGKSKMELEFSGVPIKIHVSTKTGRRYVIIFSQNRFKSVRLDYIKRVTINGVCENFSKIQEDYNKNIQYCWGITFGNKRYNGNTEYLKLTLKIDEVSQKDILNRLIHEKRNGTITRIKPDLYIYEVSLFDVSEASPWIKSFIGYIVSIDSNNRSIINRFYEDISKMQRMYQGGF